MNDPQVKRRVLTLESFAVLVALSAGEQTGREIQSRVIADGVGLYVRDSIVYATLHRFEEMGLAESRDNYYKLTEKGRHRLKHEARTLKSLIERAERRRQITRL